jgi:hypothetical protein
VRSGAEPDGGETGAVFTAVLGRLPVNQVRVETV